MTARRRDYLFGFAHILHLSPRDVDDLTLSEFEQLAAGLDAYMDELKRSAGS